MLADEYVTYSAINFESGTANASEIRAITIKLGFRLPRSIPPTYVKSISASNANCSCVIPRCKRMRRTFLPTIAHQFCIAGSSTVGHIVSREYSPYLKICTAVDRLVGLKQAPSFTNQDFKNDR